MRNPDFPIKLKPVFKNYIWGGTKLKEYWNKETELSSVAESFELSALCENESVATNEAGQPTLTELCKKYPDFIGAKGKKYSSFPLLIKLIDAERDLSVQVHPSNAYAEKYENSLGKTEMWYIADCEEGAGIYYGFKHKVTVSEVADAVKNNSLIELLNEIQVKKGDSFFVEAGTAHAIKAGVTVIEIQQSSNLTYRLYDYGRRDKDGNLRELHIDKALDVINTDAAPDVLECKKTVIHGGRIRLLAECEYFTVKELTVTGSVEIGNSDSFVALTVAFGEGAIGDIKIKKGETVVIAAGEKFTLSGNLTVIETSL